MGGRSITYQAEDPFIREEYKRMLAIEGVEFDMPDWAYTGEIPTGHTLQVSGP